MLLIICYPYSFYSQMPHPYSMSIELIPISLNFNDYRMTAMSSQTPTPTCFDSQGPMINIHWITQFDLLIAFATVYAKIIGYSPGIASKHVSFNVQEIVDCNILQSRRR